MQKSLLSIALVEANRALVRGEVPVGAALFDAEGKLIAADGNRVEERKDPTAHAEYLVLTAARDKLQKRYLTGCTIAVTLEPCAFCAAAISLMRVRRVLFGAYDHKRGAVDHGPCLYRQPTCHHCPEVYGGIAEAACRDLLLRFFITCRDKRQKINYYMQISFLAFVLYF